VHEFEAYRLCKHCFAKDEAMIESLPYVYGESHVAEFGPTTSSPPAALSTQQADWMSALLDASTNAFVLDGRLFVFGVLDLTKLSCT